MVEDKVTIQIERASGARIIALRPLEPVPLYLICGTEIVSQ